MNLDKIKQRIAETNQIFDAADKAKQRVLIAEDTLLRIECKQLLPAMGEIYNWMDWNIESLDDYTSIQSILNEEYAAHSSQCKVCAKGALFMSYVGRVNKFTLDELQNETDHDSAEMTKLLEIFEEAQLALIEAAFEGVLVVSTDLNGNIFDIDTNAIMYFAVETPNHTDRLELICRNIIKNNGTFIL